MSAKGRGSEVQKDEYYYTPLKTIRDFWKNFCHVEDVAFNDFDYILDPCAGGDELRPCAYPEALEMFNEFDTVIDTIDIRENSRASLKMDYLESTNHGNYDLIISNPPFSLFEVFVMRGLLDVREGGYVIFLQRLGVTGGQKRLENFWKHYKPKAIYVHSERPKFLKGGTDASEYAHFVFQRGYKGKTNFYWV
jgi:hypothetical protein